MHGSFTFMSEQAVIDWGLIEVENRAGIKALCPL